MMETGGVEGSRPAPGALLAVGTAVCFPDDGSAVIDTEDEEDDE